MYYIDSLPYVHIKSLRTVIHYMDYFLRSQCRRVGYNPTTIKHGKASLFNFRQWTIKTCSVQKETIFMPCLLLENFQNCIVGRCGCQAAAKSDSSLQKSIENTTTETNFKYLRLQTLITLCSIESCGSPPAPSFHQDWCFPAKKQRTNTLDTITDKKVTILWPPRPPRALASCADSEMLKKKGWISNDFKNSQSTRSRWPQRSQNQNDCWKETILGSVRRNKRSGCFQKELWCHFEGWGRYD